jgi:hypothetical protein
VSTRCSIYYSTWLGKKVHFWRDQMDGFSRFFEWGNLFVMVTWPVVIRWRKW